ncbi:MAG: hypothetical protein LCH73_07170 [Proteobacteria bacterium]|nr:hypothetical protein [Pseudomonadota bacterium]
MKLTRKEVAAAIAAAGLLAWTGGALAQVQRVAYYGIGMEMSVASVVHWDAAAGRAKETDRLGVRSGSYTSDGNGGRVLTYDVPITTSVDQSDRCGEWATLRDDQTQVIYRDLDQRPRTGKTIVGVVGTMTWVGGCDDGVSEPYATDGADRPRQRQSLSTPVDVSDLVAGTQLAGLSEEPDDRQLYPYGPPVDTVTFSGLPGTVRFERSERAYPAHLRQSGWVVMELPSGPRAYRRMATDARNGREIWLMGDMQGNELKWVDQTNMVKPMAGASFGGEEGAARTWRSSFHANGLFGFTLFPDHTAKRCDKFPDSPSWICNPNVSWILDMDNVAITTVFPRYTRVRTWEPLARYGNKQWVFETEVYQNADGSTSPYFARRVNYYEDKGPSAPPSR